MTKDILRLYIVKYHPEEYEEADYQLEKAVLNVLKKQDNLIQGIVEKMEQEGVIIQ